MTTEDRRKPELSEKSKYWIERHRYYELKHFCLQYPMWKKAYASLSGMSKQSEDPVKTNEHGDPTAKAAIKREIYSKKMALIEQSAIKADSALSVYILRGVTEGMSYDILKRNMDIPCCREMYYDRYRKFFWILSEARE